MREPADFLANCGPGPREQLRTSPVGDLSLVRPLPRVTAGLAALGARLGPVMGTKDDARLATLFRGTVPVLADTLGLRLDIRPRSWPSTLAVRLWEALRAEGRLPPLAGVVRRLTDLEIEHGEAGIPGLQVRRAPTWGPADPEAAGSPEEIAIATAVALLFPSVAVPPLLLWRREPEPSWSAYTDAWIIREVASPLPEGTHEGRSP